MFLRRCTFCLMLFLIISTTTAARKTKRPVVKPAKTFPRTNVAPSIQAQPAIANNNNNAIIPGPNAAPSISSQNDQQNNNNSNSNTNSNGNAKQAGYGSDIVTQPGTVSNESEVPKPLNSNDAETAGYAAGSTEKITNTGASASGMGTFEEECDPDQIGFEIITGYVLSAPSKLLDTLPGTLMLTECLEACQINDSCSSVNYETGLCVLFKTTSDQLPGSLSRSQFPVFTIYAQKACLGVRPCSKAWCIDRVQGYRLADHVKTSQSVSTRRDCLELCLGETDFICRSANYYRHSGLCELSDMDRITLAGGNTVEPYDGSDYLENNCAEEPSKLCEFKRISGKILKTVDSVYQDISNIEECRDLCLSSPYKCHSYDYNDTGDMVCRLSHHSRATLTDVLDPYLDVPEAATYERSSCYNVSIECRSGEMVTKIRTSKLFDGKVYAKGAPKSCSVNVNSSLEFDFRMGYDDIECNVRQSAYGRYMNDIVIQHHDTIVTSSDLGLAVSCQYDLTNRTVSNDVDLAVTGEIESSLSEEIIIDSPNIVMKITSRDGGDIKRIASVGDPLALRFEIVEPNSPYEIFVRELVAMDGTDNAEITLIDAQGCPTDHFIMGPIQKLAQNRKVLMSHFDAFKFPSSEVVQFRALVTPCIPRCEPVRCDAEDSMDSADLKSLISYGRRRRSIVNGTDGAEVLISTSTGAQREKRDVSHKPADDNILLEQSIQITDKFGFSNSDTESGSAAGADSSEHLFAGVHNNSFTCLNGYGLIVASGLFLLAQLTIITIWKSVQRRTKKERYLYHNEQASTITYGGSNASTLVYGHNSRSSNASDTLGKLYDSGINGRYGQQF